MYDTRNMNADSIPASYINYNLGSINNGVETNIVQETKNYLFKFK